MELKKTMFISKEESVAINTLRMFCVMSVVMIHSNVNHLVPEESYSSIYKIFKLFTMIPDLEILFILSGFLFFIGFGVDKDYSFIDYKKKIIKRIKSLFLPYIIWCAIGYLFGVFFTGEYEIYKSPWDYIQIFTGSGIMEHPLGRAMWYVKSLICFAFLSPFYFYFVKYFKHITPFIALVLISCDFIKIDNPIVNPYILLGAYLCFYKISLTSISRFFSIKSVIPIFILLSVVSIYFYEINYPCYLLALIGLFLLARKIRFSEKFVNTSAFIYFSHLYITGTIRNILVPNLPQGIFWYVLDMLLTWGFAMMICLLVYYLLYKFAKPVLSVITGERC